MKESLQFLQQPQGSPRTYKQKKRAPCMKFHGAVDDDNDDNDDDGDYEPGFNLCIFALRIDSKEGFLEISTSSATPQTGLC